jgi:sulfopyruvate decarboxylase subunit alpha
MSTSRLDPKSQPLDAFAYTVAPMISAASFLQTLESQGVTDVVGLPDNSSAALFARLAQDGAVKLRTVTREGEAFALATGLWIGGRRPVVLIQNTGLLESGDSLRGTAVRMRIPLVCIVTYRGYTKMMRTLGGVPAGRDAALLSRPDVDSAAVVTEPTLQAWGLPFTHLESAADLPRLAAAFAQSEEQRAPVVLLLTGDLQAEASPC